MAARRRTGSQGIRVEPRPAIELSAEHWTEAGARAENEPARDLGSLLEEALKYVEAVVEGRTRSTLDPLGASLRRALDLYSMEGGGRARLEAALLENLEEGRRLLGRLLAEAEADAVRQEAYWAETGADRPVCPAPRCGAVLDGVACSLEEGHGGPHSVLLEWEG